MMTGEYNNDDQIAHIMHFSDDEVIMTLTTGERLHLTEDDVDMLRLAFPDECEVCGFDPRDIP